MNDTNATKTNKTKATKTKTKKAAKITKATTKLSPKLSKNGKKLGRKRYDPLFPTTAEWTLREFMIANEVNPETGMGPRCSKLTLIKFLQRDSERMGHSLVKRLSKTSEPVGGTLGRKPFVYTLRKKPVVAAIADAPVDNGITVPVMDVTTPTDATPIPEEPVSATTETSTEEVTAEVPAATTDPVPVA